MGFLLGAHCLSLRIIYTLTRTFARKIRMSLRSEVRRQWLDTEGNTQKKRTHSCQLNNIIPSARSCQVGYQDARPEDVSKLALHTTSATVKVARPRVYSRARAVGPVSSAYSLSGTRPTPARHAAAAPCSPSRPSAVYGKQVNGELRISVRSCDDAQATSFE